MRQATVGSALLGGAIALALCMASCDDDSDTTPTGTASGTTTTGTSTGSGTTTGVGGQGGTTTGGGGQGLGGSGAGGGVSYDCQADPSWPTASATLEADLLDAINTQRGLGATCGTSTLPAQGALTMDATLRDLARCWARDMGEDGFFGYDHPNGANLLSVVADSYGKPPVGAGLAMGQVTADEVLNLFMTDPTLCGNVMAANATTTGIGHFATGDYWVVLFGN